VQSTIDIANRANVAIYIVDSTGLTGGTPTTGSPVVASPLSEFQAKSYEARRRSAAGESVFDITRSKDWTGNRIFCINFKRYWRTLRQNTNDIASGSTE